MHSLLRSRQGEIDRVCSQLHTGYSRCEHICARSQAKVLGYQVCSKMRLTTPCHCLTKKLVFCIKDAKQMIKRLTWLVLSSNYKLTNQMLRHQIIFQCFVLILSLVGQLSVSGFWPLLCPFGCMYFFLLPRVTVQSSYVTIRQKNCRPCFQKTSQITRGTQSSQVP